MKLVMPFLVGVAVAAAAMTWLTWPLGYRAAAMICGAI